MRKTLKFNHELDELNKKVIELRINRLIIKDIAPCMTITYEDFIMFKEDEELQTTYEKYKKYDLIKFLENLGKKFIINFYKNFIEVKSSKIKGVFKRKDFLTIVDYFYYTVI